MGWQSMGTGIQSRGSIFPNPMINPTYPYKWKQWGGGVEATVEAVVGVETGAAATEVAEIKALKYFVKIVYLYKVQVF